MGRSRLTLILLLLPGLLFRIYLAPYTTGSDIPQFAGFADTFLRHGLCFYNYSDGSHAVEEGWPYGWPYVYGPGLVLLLAPLRLLAPSPVKHFWSNGVYHVYAPIDWIISSKSLFIFFDTLAAILLYMLVKRLTGRILYGYLSLILYYYNPMTTYISAIYGMFDQIALTILLAGIMLYMSNTGDRYRILGLLLTGLSLAVKQTLLYPLLLFLFYLLIAEEKGIRVRILEVLLVIAGTIVLFIPFYTYCPSSIWVFLKALRSVSEPGYTYPVVYSFNGLSSLATYIHDCCGKDTLFMIKYWYIPSIILYLTVLLGFASSRRIYTYLGYAYIVYTATYWRVNHQYLVPLAAFTVMIFFIEKRNSVRILSLILLFLIGLWPVMFPTSWWAHAHIMDPSRDVWSLLDSLSLMVFEDLYYVLYSLALTITQILLILHGVIQDAYNAAVSSIRRLLDLSKRIINRGFG